MNRIQLLINALRSGEFKQAHQRLRIDDSYCCLGVACEVYHRETGKGEWVHNDPMTCEMMRIDNIEVDAISFLPQPVYAWYGFASADPILVSPGVKDDRYYGTCTATDMNDKLRSSFSDIADAFERTYLTKEKK